MTTVTTTAATARTARRALWRNRDFVLLWSGQTVSSLGSRMSATAVPLLVLAMTGSPATAGVIGFLGGLPQLLVQLPAGALVDRWNRWRTMLISDVGRLLVVASLPAAWWLGWLTITQVAIVAFLESTFLVFFHLAENAALPMVVSAGSVPIALAQNEAKTRGAALAGRPLGGLLFGFDRALPFVADAVSYALSTVTLLLMRRRDLAPPPVEARESLWREIVSGVRWLARHSFLRNAALLVAGSNLIFQALTLAVIVLAEQRGASPALIGVVLGCWGCGGLLGSFIAPWLQPMIPPRAVVIGVNWVWVALLPLLLLPQEPLLIGLVGGATAFIGPLWNVVIGAYMLTLVPNQLLGRVSSTTGLLAQGALPFGSLIGGLLLEWHGPAGAIWALSGFMLAIAIAASLSPSVRHAPPLPG
ncbi:MAG: MFS transporter [Micromonosporaceae bacterium]